MSSLQENTLLSRSRVLIVEDHPIMRFGLSQLISRQPDFEVCGEVEEVSGAFLQVKRTKPHIILVDLSLKGMSGIDFIKEIHARYPHIKCLVVSMHDEIIYTERVLKAGAVGFIMKQEAPDKILEAISVST